MTGRPEDAFQARRGCTRCAAEPRLLGQRWGRACLTQYARAWRGRRRITRGVTQRTEPERPAVTQVTPQAERPRAHVTRDAGLVICGQGVPPGYPSGCGLPFRPPGPWRPFYCCNPCGAGKSGHSEGCPTAAPPKPGQD